MSSYRLTLENPRGCDIADVLGGHVAGSHVVLERGLRGRTVIWSPPPEGSVRLQPSFWLSPERVAEHHVYMAIGEPDGPGFPPDFLSPRLAAVMSPDDIARQMVLDLVHDVETAATKLYEAADAAIQLPGEKGRGYRVDESTLTYLLKLRSTAAAVDAVMTRAKVVR